MPMAGVVIGGCRLESLLGRGGMGTVYRATQLALGREVAVKVVPAGSVEQTLVARFKREARTAAALEHPNSIPIYAAGEEDGLLYLVMRLVDGPDLGGLIAREGPLEPARAVRLIGQVAGALDAAHAAGLVHRDVKPGNILVEYDEGEHAYLSDFGLMRRTVDATAITRVDEWVGSIDYVAPEQVEGRPVDGRADIYSLTGVLYTAVTGERPFRRDNPTATAWAHVNSPRPAVGIPAMDEVIARGMAVSPEQRFRSARDLAAAAHAALGGVMPVAEHPTTVHRRPPPPPPSPPVARRRGVSRVGVAILALILLGGAATAAVLLSSSSSPATQTHHQLTPPAQLSHFTGNHYSFSYPLGWRLVENDVTHGSFQRTLVASQGDTESVLIDRTPGERLPPEQKFIQVQAATETTPGYAPGSSYSRTIAGHDAFVWQFSVSGPGPGPAKVDIFLELGADDYAVLGSAPTLADVQSVTMSVAASLTPR